MILLKMESPLALARQPGSLIFLRGFGQVCLARFLEVSITVKVTQGNVDHNGIIDTTIEVQNSNPHTQDITLRQCTTEFRDQSSPSTSPHTKESGTIDAGMELSLRQAISRWKENIAGHSLEAPLESSSLTMSFPSSTTKSNKATQLPIGTEPLPGPHVCSFIGCTAKEKVFKLPCQLKYVVKNRGLYQRESLTGCTGDIWISTSVPIGV
jgi:hypothetical protein